MAAAGAQDLAGLKQAMAQFEHCQLKRGARQLVFADGNSDAKIMIVGEGPGRDEDMEGRPFVGRAGQLLDRMFAAIGLSRTADDAGSSIYITNVVPWRPPQNRDPSPMEIDMMLPFLRRHIALAKPEIIVAMGNISCQALLGQRGVTKLRGQWTTGCGVDVMPMFHPHICYAILLPYAKRGRICKPFKRGSVKPVSRIDETKEFIATRIAVLTVSDTRQLDEDKSGQTLVDRLERAGHTLVDRKIIADERDQIADQLRTWIANPDVDVVISTGGTGLTGRDVTVEAHRDVYEKEIDAFGTVFTIVSMQKIGTSAIQSRATAGVAGGTYLFALPGSPGACRDAWDEILEKQLDFRHRPCNFVEIMPRLDEHLRRK